MESKAGFKEEEVNQAHGSNKGAECAKCMAKVDAQILQEHIAKGEVYYCPHCGGPVKPEITFFGQSLPDKFMDILRSN